MGGSPRSTRASCGGRSSWRVVDDQQIRFLGFRQARLPSAAAIRVFCQIARVAGTSSCGEFVADHLQERLFEIGRRFLAHELVRRTRESQRAAVQYSHAVADLVDVGKRMRGKKNSAAVLAQHIELALEERPRFRIEARVTMVSS